MIAVVVGSGRVGKTRPALAEMLVHKWWLIRKGVVDLIDGSDTTITMELP